MSDLVRKMKKDRDDLTDYIIHGTRHYGSQSSFDILHSIVQDGFFRCGWSHRGVRDTVLGHKPAVCFTEMPLWGFLHYVAVRNDPTKIHSYGIAFPRMKLFEAGARPVIYGTTLEPEEVQESGRMIVKGLPESEQYRYVLTRINEKNDWTHEREWRWANWRSHSTEDSIQPLWNIQHAAPLRAHYFNLHFVVLIVHSNEQANLLTDILVRHFEVEQIDFATRMVANPDEWIEHRLFSPDMIRGTGILVLNEFTEAEKKDLTIEAAITAKRIHLVNDEVNSRFPPVLPPF